MKKVLEAVSEELYGWMERWMDERTHRFMQPILMYSSFRAATVNTYNIHHVWKCSSYVWEINCTQFWLVWAQICTFSMKVEWHCIGPDFSVGFMFFFYHQRTIAMINSMHMQINWMPLFIEALMTMKMQDQDNYDDSTLNWIKDEKKWCDEVLSITD